MEARKYMKNKIRKKGTILVFIVLFVGANVSFSVMSEETRIRPGVLNMRTIWYVDDDGVEYPNPDFNSIQPAIDAAGVGDEIRVYKGYYPECLFVNKSLTLTGGWSGISTIEGAGCLTVVDVEANGVHFEGFTVQGCGPGSWCSGISLDKVEYCRIKGNNITMNEVGIFHWWCKYNVIENNNIYGNNVDGIDIEESEYNKISNNTFIGNGGDGIHHADYCVSNIITNNTCNDNGGSGINCCSLCVDLNGKAHSNIIENNICHGNLENGIKIQYTASNSFFNNSCKNNTNGIYLYDSYNSIITGNDFSYNQLNGVKLEYSENNIITFNTISSNNGDGIGLSDFAISNNISGNAVTSNNGRGIYIEVDCDNNLIYNNFFDNINNAFDDGTNNKWSIPITSGTNICGGTNIGGNYWSDYEPYFGVHPPYPPFKNVQAWHPDYPIPGSAGSVDEHPIPGFELFVVLGAIAIALLLFRKKL